MSVRLGGDVLDQPFVPMTPLGSSFTGLLDTYPNAKFAYSFRKLKSGVTKAVRIRETGGNTESDFGFDGSGNFDTAGASSFIGANSGFITKWYDQSGNGIDVAQSTAGQQPGYNATGINSLPAMKFNNNNDCLQSASTATGNVTQGTMFAVLLQAGATSANRYWDWSGTGSLGLWATFTDNDLYFDLGSTGGRVNFAQPAGWDNNSHLVQCYKDSGNTQAIVVDGSSLGSGTTSGSQNVTAVNEIGNSGNSSPVSGFLSEIVWWTTDLGSTNRGTANTAIKTYWGTP